MHEGKAGGRSRLFERGGEAADGIVPGLGINAVLEQAGFDGPGAAQAPIRGAHLLNHAEFHAVGGPQAGDVLVP